MISISCLEEFFHGCNFLSKSLITDIMSIAGRIMKWNSVVVISFDILEIIFMIRIRAMDIVRNLPALSSKGLSARST